MHKITESNFKRLIGIWRTSGQVKRGSDTLKLEGVDSYEFILDGNYILHKADVMIGNKKNETVEIISLDQSISKARLQYYNSEGDEGIMTGLMNDNTFQIEGNAIKFNGTINEQSTEIIGNWYVQTSNKEWVVYIELKLEKQE